MSVPAKLQNDLRQFQRLQQELSMISQQKAQFEAKLRETNRTAEELQGMGDDTPIYRSIGGLLVKATSKKEVEDKLTEEKETLEVRIKAVDRQEGHLRERYETMQKDLTAQIRASGLKEPPAAPETE